MYILYIYIYIIRVYTLEPPPSNRTHSVHVSEGLSITVSLVLQGIGGDRTQSSFFYCRSQVTLVYNMYWSDQHFFGRLIFHFMVKTSKHITQAMGHLGSRCISCISYIYIYTYIYGIYIYASLPDLLLLYIQTTWRRCRHATRCSVSSPQVRTERRLLCVTSGTPKPGLYGVF